MTIPEEIEVLKSQLSLTKERDQAAILIPLILKYLSIQSTDCQTYVDQLTWLTERYADPHQKAWSLHCLSGLKLIQADYKAALSAGQMAADLFEKLNDTHGLVLAYNNVGRTHQIQSNFAEALKSLFAAMEIAERTNDQEGMALSHNNIGTTYLYQGRYPEAMKCQFAGLRIWGKLDYAPGIARSYTYIGNINYSEGDLGAAMRYQLDACEIWRQTGNKTGEAAASYNIGNIHYDLHDYTKALKYHLSALTLKEEAGDKYGISLSYNSLGNIHNDLGDYSQALANHFSSLKIKEEIGDKRGMASSYNNIGGVYKNQGLYPEALNYLREALRVSEEIGYKILTKVALFALSELYNATGDFENALRYFKKYHEAEKELQGEESQKQLNDLQFMHNLEQKEKDAAFEKQKREESEHLRNIVEQKNLALIQSISYAQNIQTAILPPIEKIRKFFPDSFVLYMPKDIVSGDFYWMEEIGDQGPDLSFTRSSVDTRPSPLVLFAACDCTGHGVPGAMVSLVCHNALNRVLHEYRITLPSLILDKVCELVVESFKTGDGDVRDGMDISLCAFDPETRTVQWSGANTPLWLLRSGIFTEIRADKQPIGKTDYGHRFTNHQLDLEIGDIIYIFTDGYSDQFGGPAGKKLGRKKMKELLLNLQGMTVSEQGYKLREFIMDYKKDTFQIDDILVIGMKIN